MGNPTLPTLDTIMKATIVEPGDIATVSFVSSALIILQDDGDFGDESVLNSIAAQDDQTRPTIPSLPSIPFPVRDKSNFRLMLGRYYSGRYDILSGLQIHKFSETRSIEWDPQGQQRLVAHYVLNDIYVTPPGGEKVLVRRASTIFCPPYCLSIVVSPATPSQECTVVTILTRAKG